MRKLFVLLLATLCFSLLTSIAGFALTVETETTAGGEVKYSGTFSSSATCSISSETFLRDFTFNYLNVGKLNGSSVYDTNQNSQTFVANGKIKIPEDFPSGEYEFWVEWKAYCGGPAPSYTKEGPFIIKVTNPSNPGFDKNWKRLVVNADTNTREYNYRWFQPEYDDSWWNSIIPPTVSGSDANLLRKKIYLEKPSDLWIRAWEGYSGYCYVNGNRIDGTYVHAGPYLKTGENLIACTIWGPGRDGITTTFYGDLVPVPDNYLTWSSGSKWYTTKQPVTSATTYNEEPKTASAYECEISAGGSVTRTTCYYAYEGVRPWMQGTTTLVKTIDTNGKPWLLAGVDTSFSCSANNNPLTFSTNTHQKYNHKAPITEGSSTVNCILPKQEHNRIDLGVSPDLQIIELTEYSVPFEDPTITVKLSGSGNVTVFADLFSGTEIVSKRKTNLTLNNQGLAKITMFPRTFGQHTVSITAVYADYGLSVEKTYNLEVLETAPEPIGNPFVFGSGEGSKGSDLPVDPSSLFPLAVGLGGAGAGGLAYLVFRAGRKGFRSKFDSVSIAPPLGGKASYPKGFGAQDLKRSKYSAFNPFKPKQVYGEPSEGPEALTAEFWKQVEKEKKEYEDLLKRIAEQNAAFRKMREDWEREQNKIKTEKELKRAGEEFEKLTGLLSSGEITVKEAEYRLNALANNPYMNLNMKEKFLDKGKEILGLFKEPEKKGVTLTEQQKAFEKLNKLKEQFDSGKLSPKELITRLDELLSEPGLDYETKARILGAREEILRAVNNNKQKEVVIEGDGKAGAGNGGSLDSNPITAGLEWFGGLLGGIIDKGKEVLGGVIDFGKKVLDTGLTAITTLGNTAIETGKGVYTAITGTLTGLLDGFGGTGQKKEPENKPTDKPDPGILGPFGNLLDILKPSEPQEKPIENKGYGNGDRGTGAGFGSSTDSGNTKITKDMKAIIAEKYGATIADLVGEATDWNGLSLAEAEELAKLIESLLNSGAKRSDINKFIEAYKNETSKSSADFFDGLIRGLRQFYNLLLNKARQETDSGNPIAIIVLSALALIGIIIGAQIFEIPTNEYMLAGEVSDQLGNPLSFTTVALHGSGEINKTLSGENGKFVISGRHPNNTLKAMVNLTYYPNGEGVLKRSAGYGFLSLGPGFGDLKVPAVEMVRITGHNANWSKVETENVYQEISLIQNITANKFFFSNEEGGNAYYGLRLSYDYWKERGEYAAIGLVSDERANKYGAYYCPRKGGRYDSDGKFEIYSCNDADEIHFSTGYQNVMVAAHEYGHGVARSWGLPQGHTYEKGLPNGTDPMDEAFAHFSSVLVRCKSGMPDCTKLTLPKSLLGLLSYDVTYDVTTAKDLGHFSYPEREVALAGLMWDLEQVNPGSVYSILSKNVDPNYKYNITITSKLAAVFVEKHGKDVCNVFVNHGFTNTTLGVVC